MSEADLIRASIASLVGVATYLILLRWVPVFVAFAFGCGACALIVVLA